MARKCSECPDSYFGSRNALSDACDGCRHDPNTAWGGETDHSLNLEDDDEIEDFFGVLLLMKESD